MDRFDPFVKYADVYGDIINWEKDPMNKPQNQNKYFFSDGKTYYEQICKMLRLMSVFKEAFNQIYNNEDEISEAWENFVNNLSASVVEGSEPDVTLTWTDDSVNFEFTMVPGVPGDPGVGITSISFNSDYTMTITLSDGSTYTSMSLKGDTGPQGPQGETGSGLQILDVYATLADLQSAHPTGQPGDAYQVGSGGSYTLYIWSSSQSAWVQAGTLGTVSPYTSAPLMDGTASAGSQNLYARGDHVHPSDTSRASQEELDELIKTSQSLIDQSFTYRESPAIQDGLARIDKIKGNTLIWNQLVKNGNFADTSNWTTGNATLSVSSNKATLTVTNNGTVPFYQTINKKTAEHIVLVLFDAYASRSLNLTVNWGFQLSSATLTTSNQRFAVISTLRTFGNNNFNLSAIAQTGDVINYSNVQLFDLTQMFGAGNEPITVEEFTSLFPLSYYDFNQGTLLSFNGSGIKTVGSNLVDITSLNASTTNTTLLNLDREITTTITIAFDLVNASFTSLSTAFFNFVKADNTNQYKLTNALKKVSDNQTLQANTTYNERVYFTVSNITFKKLDMYFRPNSYATWSGAMTNVSVYYSDNTAYIPYQETTIDLPISTYFPTGMKSAGAVYDELTPIRAITRIGSIDLGTLTWERLSDSYTNTFSAIVSDIYNRTSGTENHAVCSKYESENVWLSTALSDKKFMIRGDVKRVYIHDSSYSDAQTFKTAMSGVYLCYELATPAETAVDLDLDFMAYEDGTEQLLPVNASVPSTSPIRSDMTYLSIDDAMEYIIEKLANVPLNTQQILESLEDDVADLQTDVGALQPAVSALQTSVGNINTNIGQLSSTVAGHTSSISDMQSDITDLNTDLSDLSDTVTDHTSRIGTLESGLSATNGNVQNLETSVSDLDDTVTAQGTTVTALDDIISDISNNPVLSSLGSHELGFTVASVEVTLPANTGTMVTIPKPTIFPNNYTPLFIVGMSTGSYNVSICSIPYTFGNSNSVTCRVWNHGSEQTTQISVYILCMRQKQSQ